MNKDILSTAENAFSRIYGTCPDVVSYAPGRVEILGNHTDYNEGYVLSCAINAGTFFLLAASGDNSITLTAADVNETVTFGIDDIRPAAECRWANYIKGVIAGMLPLCTEKRGFKALFLGDIPIGSGLSSSAALEISTAQALARFWNITLGPLDAAKIGQKAEHEFAGAKCGLLDQISSLYGRDRQLVLTDFRSLHVRHSPFEGEHVFLACNTHAKHALVDGAYNERRNSCEKAAAFFASNLSHPVRALRDVSSEELRELASSMDRQQAMRAAHVIGENERVLQGITALENRDFALFGKLMFESHKSSQLNFENSCPELDFIVNAVRKIPGVLGARLSGGGFGGSVIALVNERDTETISKAIKSAYSREFGHSCDTLVIKPSEGASLV